MDRRKSIGVTFEIRVLTFVDIQFPEILWIGCEIQSSSERDPAVNWEWWGWCLYASIVSWPIKSLTESEVYFIPILGPEKQKFTGYEKSLKWTI